MRLLVALLLVTAMIVSTLTIDFEWAESLTGLPMSVPEHWWPGYSGRKNYAGRIKSIDRDAENGCFFASRSQMSRARSTRCGMMRCSSTQMRSTSCLVSSTSRTLPQPIHPAIRRSVFPLAMRVCRRDPSSLRRLLYLMLRASAAVESRSSRCDWRSHTIPSRP